jgi:hypothetical protein
MMVSGATASGADTTITTTGATQLGSINAGSALNATGGSILVGGATASGGALNLKTTGSDLTLAGDTNAVGAVVLDVAGLATIGKVSGSAVSLTARDAVLSGTIIGSQIDISDRGTTGNILRVGDNAPGSGGFALSAAEMNLLSASTVALHAGTVSGQTAQDVAIGTLNLTNAAIKTLSVDALLRIDLTGALTASGLTGLRLGGVAAASSTSPPTQLATVLRIAAKADGTGGQITAAGALLDLQAATIGAGQDVGFLTFLGVTAGSTASVTAKSIVTNPFSELYSAGSQGGLGYATFGQNLVTANRMTVSYSNFALFQNTQVSGSNGGVTLATIATPSTPALQVFGLGTPAGAIAIFGTINGIGNISTALLGPSIIQVKSIDQTAARINGCLIGSAAGCLNTPISPPTLDAIDQSRTGLVLPNADFQLPFNPLVGTNNDSLFGDVGGIGLSDLPIAAIDCPDGDKSCSPTNPNEKPEGKK